LSCAEIDDFALLPLVDRCGDPFGYAVSSSNQCGIGATDVMSRRHASPRMPEQFPDRGVSIAFVGGEARECPPQVVAASVVQSRCIEKSAYLLFQIGWTGARPAWENQFVVEPKN